MRQFRLHKQTVLGGVKTEIRPKGLQMHIFKAERLKNNELNSAIGSEKKIHRTNPQGEGTAKQEVHRPSSQMENKWRLNIAKKWLLAKMGAESPLKFGQNKTTFFYY